MDIILVEKLKEQVPKQAQTKTNKKLNRTEEEFKKQSRDLSFVKFKSLFAVTFTMIIFVSFLNSW